MVKSWNFYKSWIYRGTFGEEPSLLKWTRIIEYIDYTVRKQDNATQSPLLVDETILLVHLRSTNFSSVTIFFVFFVL